MTNGTEEVTADDEHLKKLKAARGAVKGQITKLETWIAAKTKRDEFDVDARVDMLDEYYRSFITLQDQVESMDSKENKERCEMDTRICEARAKLKRLRFQLSQSSRGSVTAVDPSDPSRPIRVEVQAPMEVPLPKLPTFNGDDYLAYPNFIAAFEALVENNTTAGFTDLKKFTILRGALEGRALQAVNHLMLSDENYEMARSILEVRFLKPRLIFQSLLRKLLDLPKVTSLRKLLDHLNANLRALEGIPATLEQIGCGIMMHHVLKVVDEETLSRWEDQMAERPAELPDWNEFMEFLGKRADKQESRAFLRRDSKPSSSQRLPGQQDKNTYLAERRNCSLCDGDCADLTRCKNFQSKSPKERYNWIRSYQRCIQCLDMLPHDGDKCTAEKCSLCKRNHHTLLHFDDHRQPRRNNVTTTAMTAHTITNSKKTQILGTAVIQVKAKNGTWVQARALIDSGSMVHFITKRLASKLRIKLKKATAPVTGLFGAQEIRESTQLTIKSAVSEYDEHLDVLILPEFKHLHPSVKLDAKKLNLPSNIPLADPTFDVPQRVDVLLGVGVAFKLLMVGQINVTDSLILQKTQLGWVMAGELVSNQTNPHKYSLLGTSTPADEDLHNAMQRFWELDKVPAPAENWSPNERFCEDHFQQYTTRNETGRFVVRLPFTTNPDELGNSYQVAESRLKGVERRMANDEEFKKLYQEFLTEYEELGHMHPVQNSVVEALNYLPHHGVLRPESTSTKLRVVFDASAATSNGMCLNDCMPHGATIQPSLFYILIKFRYHRVGLSGDIPKMFRQIMVHDDDRRHQCILWRRPGSDQISTFKLATVTYGTTSAPFLAVRCVTELARTESGFELATEALLDATYVDNTLTGASTAERATQLYLELKRLLNKGGMDMKKWCSNSPDVLQIIPPEHLETLQPLGDDQLVKTLGIHWNTATDEFVFTFTPDELTTKWTKRKIVSHIAKIFDPLGLVGPVTTLLKIFAQDLWTKKLHWDESLPHSILTRWLSFLEDLPRLADVRLPRYVFRDETQVIEAQLHCFADASMLAYGTVFFVRCQLQDGEVSVINLCSKSRVAPLKRVTLPRLELCGALLLSELLAMVMPTLSMRISKTYCWLDSQVALTWVTNSPHKYGTFISSRATVIQDRTAGCSWRHIPGAQNPADVLSRGAKPSSLLKDRVWFTGPEFLYQPEELWRFPKTDNVPEDDERLECRKPVVCLYNRVEEDLVQGFKFNGSLYRIQKTFAYVNRYLKIHKGEAASFRTQPFTTLDLQEGLLLAVRAVQQAQFRSEYQLLGRGKLLAANHAMLKLSPFIDNNGLLRVGGRLGNAPDLTFDEAHPLLLPRDHPLSSAIFRFYHWSMPHPGPLTMLASIRRKYWIVGGMTLANRTYRRCLVCVRHARRTFQQIMANLPLPRVMPFRRCFTVVGIDLFGPFQVKHSGRGSVRSTMYVAVIIDFQTKAVQLQYVDGDGTNSIINALLRFVNRAGRPAQIWSDNATNFVGANNSFQHIEWDKVDQWCRMTQKVEWKFIPARSPHWGGLWEASVRLAKRHLLKVMTNKVLHWDAFITLLSMVEAVVNSRPITPLAINPNDGHPLTPAHFLINEPLITFPDPQPSDFPPGKRNLVKCWLELCEIRTHWVERWQTELRQTYQNQQKWHSGSKNIRLGKVVLMVDKDKAPYAWATGRITKLMPGRDGRVRAVEVTCPPLQKNGPLRIFNRAVQMLVPVPMDDDEDEE